MSMSGSGSGSSDNEPSAKKLKFLMSESELELELESESELESENSDNESLTKKPKIVDPITDELAHLEATEEAALKSIIWNRCSYILELCKKLSDQLYHRVLDRAAMLVCLIYDKRGPLYEACKWIVCKKVDHDRYSLLNENDVAALLLVKLLCFDGFRHSVAISVIILFLLMFTFDMQMYWSLPDRKPYLDFYDKEFVKSAIDDDIQEAIRKAKLFPRLTVDQYTCLLIEMVRAKVRNGWIFCSPKLRRQLI
ncbi:uncharacterized protein LOC104894134 isoform X2 [Beta vulgaris subsp. vulgaris]|uniref:uncharacterized protein LOC104894134 isoform X2 n=1 Tax=Beta vulgaris subsp. vulgaris TaxID=3555 RepID=UPI0025479100|nr:uncharacterized protein LOC104894134 isoform X2 [Beta vulgaris subsp. vulgaris]